MMTDRQLTNHVMMIDPVGFCANPQTMDSNAFQEKGEGDAIEEKARQEAAHVRNCLISKGVMVTAVAGREECPDALFCNNWVSTHEDGKMVLYPMAAANRRPERRADLIDYLNRLYPHSLDFSAAEQEGLALESTGSLIMDRVNRIAYAAISSRTDPGLVTEWCAALDYEPVLFTSRDREGQPFYHTNVIMFIAAGVVALCPEAIPDEAARETVLARLQHTHEVVLLDMDQVYHFCGNMLALESSAGQRLLVMSETAYGALRPEQKAQFSNHCDELLAISIPVIEKHGGGSVRCMLLELF